MREEKQATQVHLAASSATSASCSSSTATARSNGRLQRARAASSAPSRQAGQNRLMCNLPARAKARHVQPQLRARPRTGRTGFPCTGGACACLFAHARRSAHCHARCGVASSGRCRCARGRDGGSMVGSPVDRFGRLVGGYGVAPAGKGEAISHEPPAAYAWTVAAWAMWGRARISQYSRSSLLTTPPPAGLTSGATRDWGC